MSASGGQMTLVLLRHGATPGNERHCYVGKRTNESLSDAGRAQCAALGTREDVELVYASSLLRARQTAELCFPCAHVVSVAGLEEFDFGDFEGRTANEMADDAAYRAWVDSSCVDACPNGESRASYLQRSNTALAGVLREARERGEQRVVVVAHGGTIMAAMSAFAAPDERKDYFEWHVGTAQGYTAQVAFADSSSQPVFSHCQRFSKLGELF